jgi:drug/metabolite transporter (DMT)-like permease
MTGRTLGITLALGAALISGFNVFVNSYGVAQFKDATLYTTGKNLVAAIVLFAALAAAARIRRGEGLTPPRTGGQWAGLAAVAAIGGSVPFVLFFEGLARATAADSQFIHKTLVVWVAVLAVVFLRERIGPWHVAAIALLIAGQAVLQTGLAKVGLGPGELMILGATLLWSVELVIAKRLLGSLSALTVGTARMAGGVIILVAWSAATGHLAPLSAAQWMWVLITGALLAVYVGTWYAALARAQAVDVTAALVSATLVTSLLNAAVKGAPIAAQAGGLAVIAAGTALLVLAALRARGPLEGSVRSPA